MAATTLPKTQTAFAITTVGSPLTKIEIPVPEPKGDELLVRLTATGVAPFDQKLRDYGPFDIGSRLPVIVTYDAVGVVEKYSDELSQELKTKFPLGSHVFAQPSIFNPLSGGLQQYTTIAAPFTSIVPSSISDVEAALYPINGITSFAALFSTEGSPEGKNRGLGIPFPGTPGSECFDYKNTTIMILGGGSRCGKLAIQFAKLAGIGGILTTCSKSSFDEMKKLGATHVFDRRSENLVEEVRKVTGDELVYVCDTMSRESELDLGAKLLSDNKKGYFSHLLNGKISEDVLAQKKGGVQDWHMMGSSAWHPKLSAVFWENIGSWIDNGLTGGEYKVLEGPLNKEGVLEGVNKVLDAYRDGGFQRVHVKISE